MAKGKDRGVLDRVFSKAGAGRRVRSSLSKKLTTEHDDFAARLAAGDAKGAPYNWEDLAEGFTEEGFTDADGNRLTGDRLRRTWARVTERVIKAREKAGEGAAPSESLLPPIPTPLTGAKPVSPPNDDAEGGASFPLPPASRLRNTGDKENK